jgi:hypothetical protein
VITLEEIARRTWESALTATHEHEWREFEAGVWSDNPGEHPCSGYEYAPWARVPGAPYCGIAFRPVTLARVVELTELWRT